MWYLLYASKLLEHHFSLIKDDNTTLLFNQLECRIEVLKKDKGRVVISQPQYTIDVLLDSENELIRLLEQLYIIKYSSKNER